MINKGLMELCKASQDGRLLKQMENLLIQEYTKNEKIEKLKEKIKTIRIINPQLKGFAIFLTTLSIISLTVYTIAYYLVYWR